MSTLPKLHQHGRAVAWIAVIERDGRRKRTVRLAIKFQSGNRIALDFAPSQARDVQQAMASVLKQYEADVAAEATKKEKPAAGEARASGLSTHPNSNQEGPQYVRRPG